MPAETIRVFYEPLGQVPGTGTTFYHETLVYTNSRGQQFLSSCYGTGAGPTGLTDTLSGMGNAASGSATSWGTLACTTAAVDSPLALATWGQAGQARLLSSSNPSATVSTGTDLSQQWSTITQAELQITNQHLAYSPLTLNSNSAAETAMVAAGIAAPQDVGFLGPHWAPAGGRVLTTTFTQPSNPETIDQSTDALGNRLVTITEKDAAGHATNSIQINAATNAVDIKAFSAGAQQFDETTTTNANGIVTAVVSGQGVVEHLDGATIIPGNNTTGTFQGSNDNLTVPDGATVTVTGNGLTIHLGSGDNVTVTGSNCSITGGTGDHVTVLGNTDNLTLGSNAVLTITGTAETVNTYASSITLGNGTTGTLTGPFLAVYAGSNDTFTATGGGIAISATGSGNSVTIGGNGQNAADVSKDVVYGGGAAVKVLDDARVDIYDSNATLMAGVHDTLVISGSTDNLTTGGNAIVTLTGTGETVNSYASSITLGNGTTGTLTGPFLTVNAGSNDTITATGLGIAISASGSGDSFTIGGNGQNATGSSNDVVYATGAVVHLLDNSRVDIYDSNATITGGAHDNFGAYGAGLTVNGQSTDSIWVGGNGGAGVADVVNSGGATYAIADNSNVTVYGVGGAFLYGTGDRGSNYDAGGTVTVNGTNTDLTGYGLNTTFTFVGANDTGNMYGNGEVTYNYGINDQTNDLGSWQSVFNQGSNELGYLSSSTDTIFNSNSSDLTWSSFTPDYYFTDGGFAGNRAAVSATIAKGLAGAASSQGLTFEQVQYALTSGAKTMMTGSLFDHRVITWSVSAPSTPSGGSVDTTAELAAKQAFDAWAVASGLTFKEVKGSESADIQIGWTDLKTASTGLVGLTTIHSQAGHIASGVVISLENQAETQRLPQSDGSLTYSGTQATLAQVLLHEVGHALGLADSADPTSIENFFLDSGNRTISSNDAEAVQRIYWNVTGHNGPYISPETQAMIDVMASFAPGDGASAVHLIGAGLSHDIPSI